MIKVEIKYGYTRAQEPIFLILVGGEVEIRKYTKPASHIDALALFEFLKFREYRFRSESEDYFRFHDASMLHRDQLVDANEFDKFKTEYGIITSFHLRDFGRSLALKHLQDY
jgi:hypothetical protein